jgi:hypothetical protein
LAAWGVRVPQAGEAAAVARGPAQPPAGLAASEPRREAVTAAQHAAAEAEPAFAPEVAGVAVVRALQPVEAAAVPQVVRLAEAAGAPRVQEAAAGAHPSAAAFSPSRHRSVLARRPSVNSGHASLRLRIASP